MTSAKDAAAGDDITITDTLRAKLRVERQRTGVTAINLLKACRDVPDGLNARAVNRWIGGLIRSAPASDLNYVVALWAALPDHPGQLSHDGGRRGRLGRRQPKEGESWIVISEAMRLHLRDELTRTGLTVPQLFRMEGNLPFGLNLRVFNGWLYGEIGQADQACWTFANELLRGCPAKA